MRRTLMVVRHALSIAILPFTVTILVPLWIAGGSVSFPARRSAAAVLGIVLGAILVGAGLVLFVASLRRFASDGEGTLAPWDPPRKFVVTGPYRYVRNPMISGVLLILFGEAAALQTKGQLGWALGFLAMNAIQIPLFEEPQLRRRFGESYVEYCRHVGRLLPRATPKRPDAP